MPYLGLAILEFCMIAPCMRTVFQVPVHGQFVTLLTIAQPFFLAMLGMGLISTRVDTRDAAMQMAMGTVIPSIFLSGYIFPIDSMPAGFYYLSLAIPTTWMVDASRGVILRHGWAELWRHAVVLSVMATVAPDRQAGDVPQAGGVRQRAKGEGQGAGTVEGIHRRWE